MAFNIAKRKQPLSQEEYRAMHAEIVKIYDFAEGILDAIERSDCKDPELELSIASPFIDAMQNCGKILEETFASYVDDDQKASTSDLRRTEAALRSVFIQSEELIKQVDALPKPGGDND